MLPMLTGVVIMLAIGLFAQRSETIMSWLGEDTGAKDTPQMVFNTDAVVVSRGGFTRLDVLANDANMGAEDAAGLLIVRAPECGDAFVQDGAIQYRPASHCGNFDTFTYRLAGAPDNAMGSVHVNIVSPEEIMAAKISADEDPAPVGESAPAKSAPAPADEVIAAVEPAAPAAAQAQPLADQTVLVEDPAPADSAPAPVEEADGPIGSGEMTVALAVPDAPVPESPAIDESPAPAAAPEAPAVEAPPATEAPEVATPEPAPAAPEPVAETEVAEVTELGLPQLTEFNPEATRPQAGTLLEEPVMTLAAITADPSLERDHLTALGRGSSAFDAVPSGPVNRLIAPNRATELVPLADPGGETGAPPINAQSLTTLPALELPTGGLAPLAKPDAPVTPPPVVAALPDPVVACATPPAVSFDAQAAGQTRISLIAPCNPDGVAELSYHDLRFAIPLDGEGRGTITALGFEPTTPATIRMEDGAELSFDLAFEGTDRVLRVALAWDLPVQISLHALEFGAELGSEGDIWNANPKSYGEIRPTGGGYLTTYLPEQGAGQPIEIYTHLVRRNGRKGVVELKVEYTSRDRERLAGTCGPGDLARPHIRILRSEAGRMGRPFAGRLPSVACDESGASGDTLAANSVGTLVVTP